MIDLIEVRALTLLDANNYYDMIDRSRADLTMFTWVEEFSLERATELLKLKTSNDAQNKIFVFGIFKEARLIGSIEVREHNIKIDGREVGYFMDSSNRGVGYMKYSLKFLMDRYIDKIPFYADVLEDNTASLWLLWSLGYKEDYRWKQEENSQILVRLTYTRHIV